MPEVQALIDQHAPNLRPLVCPKDYTIPHGYDDPSVAMLSAFVGAVTVARGLPAEMDTTAYSMHSTFSTLIRYQMPTYFVSQELCEALLETEAPEDLRFDEIKLPMPAMMFMLPAEFAQAYFGWDVPFITATVLEPQSVIKTPIQVWGQRVREVIVGNETPIFCATMLDWENGMPMHYDSRCPTERPVKDMLTADLRYYARGFSLTTTEQDRQTVRRLGNVAVNLLLAMTAEPELVTRERMLRPAKWKDHTIVRRALWKASFIGEHFRVQYERNDTPAGSHRSPHAHWRKGHWRNQRHGPQNALVKRIWLKPVYVGLTNVLS